MIRNYSINSAMERHFSSSNSNQLFFFLIRVDYLSFSAIFFSHTDVDKKNLKLFFFFTMSKVCLKIKNDTLGHSSVSYTSLTKI